jgi:hypothetical protein
LRLGVLVQRLDERDYGVKVVRRHAKGAPLVTVAAARATDPLSALAGATAAAVEALRDELKSGPGNDSG